MELPQEEEAAAEGERFKFLHSFLVRITSLRAVSHQTSGEREHVFIWGSRTIVTSFVFHSDFQGIFLMA